MMELTQFLALLKQYGPLLGLFLFYVYWSSKRIDSLLERNSKIYDDHIQHLWETQNQLLTALLGAQGSSQTAPTVDDLKKKGTALGKAAPEPKALESGDKS